MVAGCMAALAARAAFAQAVLPTSYTGPWQGYAPPAGWFFSGLGAPEYAPGFDGHGDGAAKLDDAGDFISIQCDSAPAAVSFWIKGQSFSGGVFRVDQSVDGTNWLELASYAPPPTNATFQTLGLSLDARCVRFIYAARETGNVGLDGISIAKNVPFAIQRAAWSNDMASVWLQPTAVGRQYQLQYSTNLPASNAWHRIEPPGEGTGGELELRDLNFDFPRYYRVVDVTAAAKRRRPR